MCAVLHHRLHDWSVLHRHVVHLLPSSFGFLVRFPWFIVSMLIVRDEVNSCVLRWSTEGRSVGCISDPRMSANARMTSGLSCDLSFNPSESLIGYPDTGCVPSGTRPWRDILLDGGNRTLLLRG